ncbi:DExH-box ATP-dependent RNA helicase DExH14 [Vitis vinifera]|uniref:DExH-box ATP-dependent RNA helicase DExH14 n=1 Tax=Vitis vinifera TaxID=29760 RepID=A0A438HM50_VITVI|nr:DExH-box ATP-dependent RNA helicase DExH14 [Vitis vinifera]
MEVMKSRNKDLVEYFGSGVGIHHAGMLRADRGLTERLFSDGLLKVLVCTATLAWGVNLPAHTVVIKGTQLYDPKAGGWRDLGMLDIFGRAGRPQFDKSGEGIIITSHEKLAYYLRLLTSQLPIESQFISSLKDNLNAEVALGTVTNVKEACAWLGYTYLFIRMRLNPLAYGIGWDEVIADPSLSLKQRAFVTDAARALDKAKMMRFDEKSGNFYCTELGRIASHFYIQYSSVETYNEMLRRHMNDSEVIDMVAHSSEFENIVVREEEQNELEMLARTSCPLEIKGGPSNKHGKISILIQLYISRGSIDSFSLISDAAYISASLARIMRALFEICLRRGWCEMCSFMLDYCKAVDRQVWPHQHPLRQFDKDLSSDILRKLEDRGADLDRLYDMQEKDIGALIRYASGGKLVKQYLGYFPSIQLSATVSPITRTVLKIDLLIASDFVWKDRFHGAAQRWWILVEVLTSEPFPCLLALWLLMERIQMHIVLYVQYNLRGSSATLKILRGQTSVDIPTLEMEVIQPAFPYQMFESVNPLSPNPISPIKDSNMVTGNQGVTAGSPSGEFQIEGLSPRKMAKVREVLKSLDIKGLGSKKKRRVVKDFMRLEKPDVVMIQETKKAECDRREEVVLGSFSVSIKFALDGCEPFWLSAVYGPNNSALRKDFWVELSDIFWAFFSALVCGRFTFKERTIHLVKLARASRMQEIRSFPSWKPIRSSGANAVQVENMWLQHPSFKESFGSWWREFQGNGWEGHKFMRKLQFVKAKLKEWNKASFEELKSFKKRGARGVDFEGRNTLETKSRVKWVKEGDCNSTFFHKVANGRQNRKYIKELENESGLMLNNSESIKEEILRLESLFSEEEISKAIFQLDRDKTPGPDDFTIAVFQDFLVNGNAKGWVKAFRGLRQGDPLSPFLFTIVADVLNDTIFFSSTREEDMMTLKSVLLVFEHIFGLKVNLDKSNIYGINLEQNHLSRLAEMLDCKASGWPIFLPRITPIQSCLTHMPCYFLSLFKIPASMAAKVERLQRDFLWSSIGEGKRDHLGSGCGDILGGVQLCDIRAFHSQSFFLALSQISYSPPVFLTKFVWNSQVPFKVKSFVWLVAHKKDSDNDHIYHSENFTLTKRMARGEPQKLSFTVPIFEPHPPQYYIRAVSDSWLQAEAFYTISFHNLALPEARTSHTELLDLKPLPVTSLGNRTYELLYKFSHFNPIQTQTFHVLYHTDNNVLLGAPTGSGKTISAELAMLHLFNTQPDMKCNASNLRQKVKLRSEGLTKCMGSLLRDHSGITPRAYSKFAVVGSTMEAKILALLEALLQAKALCLSNLNVEGDFSILVSWVIYIAPLKAIVRERMIDWKKRIVSELGKEMVEMTGDYTPDLMALMSADIIISTPEKWDGISRNWHNRGYVKKVGLMILDEIHLLGADRGPILEVIVSRMRYISSQTERTVRFVGLSTALANAGAFEP